MNERTDLLNHGTSSERVPVASQIHTYVQVAKIYKCNYIFHDDLSYEDP